MSGELNVVTIIVVLVTTRLVGAVDPLLSLTVPETEYVNIPVRCNFTTTSPATTEDALTVKEVMDDFFNGFDSLEDQILVYTNWNCGDTEIEIDEARFFRYKHFIFDMNTKSMMHNGCYVPWQITSFAYNCTDPLQTCDAEDNQNLLSTLNNCMHHKQYYTTTIESLTTTDNYCSVQSIGVVSQDDAVLRFSMQVTQNPSMSCYATVFSPCLSTDYDVTRLHTGLMTLERRIVQKGKNDFDCQATFALCSSMCVYKHMTLGLEGTCIPPSCDYYLCGASIEYMMCSNVFFRTLIWFMITVLALLIIRFGLWPVAVFVMKIQFISAITRKDTSGKVSVAGSPRLAMIMMAFGLIPLSDMEKVLAQFDQNFQNVQCTWPETFSPDFNIPLATTLESCELIGETGEEQCTMKTVINMPVNMAPGSCYSLRLNQNTSDTYVVSLCSTGYFINNELAYDYTAVRAKYTTSVKRDCQPTVFNAADYVKAPAGVCSTMHVATTESTRCKCCWSNAYSLLGGRLVWSVSERYDTFLPINAISNGVFIYGLRIYKNGEIIQEECRRGDWFEPTGEFITAVDIIGTYTAPTIDMPQKSRIVCPMQGANRECQVMVMPDARVGSFSGFGSYQIVGPEKTLVNGVNKTACANHHVPSSANGGPKITDLGCTGCNGATDLSGAVNVGVYFPDPTYAAVPKKSLTAFFQNKAIILSTSASSPMTRSLFMLSLQRHIADVSMELQFTKVSILRALACPSVNEEYVEQSYLGDGVDIMACLSVRSTCGDGIVFISFTESETSSCTVTATPRLCCSKVPLSEASQVVGYNVKGSTEVSGEFMVVSSIYGELFHVNETNTTIVSHPTNNNFGFKTAMKFGIPDAGASVSDWFKTIAAWFTYLAIGVFAVGLVWLTFKVLPENKRKRV